MDRGGFLRRSLVALGGFYAAPHAAAAAPVVAPAVCPPWQPTLAMPYSLGALGGIAFFHASGVDVWPRSHGARL
jgi:hypothetical protein